MTQDFRHDPARCNCPDCRLCDVYHAGYAAGKAKAHFEPRAEVTPESRSPSLPIPLRRARASV